MMVKLLHQGAARSFAVVLDKREEVGASLLQFAREYRVSSGSLQGIGALSDAVLGFFEPDQRDYRRIVLPEQLEVVALTGNIATSNGEPKLHCHVVVSKRDGTALGGHLIEGHVLPSLEVFVQEAAAQLVREMDEESGLTLIRR